MSTDRDAVGCFRLIGAAIRSTGNGSGGSPSTVGAAVVPRSERYAGLIRPRLGTKRTTRSTIGPVVCAVAEAMGLEFYPWQRYRADVCGELFTRPDGHGRRLAANTTMTMVGRQTGKTTAVTADVATRCMAPDIPELAALVGHPVAPQHVAMTAQDRIAALRQWYEHVELIMASDLAAHVDKVVRKNGEECVHFSNGSKYRVVTPSRTGARGLSLDVCVIDEALAHEPWLLDVIGPTMAQRDGARVSFGAQLVIVSNAGDENAIMLNQQREIGRRAVAERDRSRVHLEWSCADDDDVLDPKVWARTIPTLDQPDGLATTWLARQAETIGTDAFAREYLCRTVISAKRKVLDFETWMKLPYGEARGGEPVYAVEFNPERTGAVLVAAVDLGDVYAVELIEDRAGVDWVMDRTIALAGRTARVMVDKFSPAATIIPGLRQHDVDVVDMSSREVTDAAGLFVDLVYANAVAHTGDPILADSLINLARRQRGDRWSFDRYEGRPAPVIAASLAVWALDTTPVPQVKVW